MALETIQLLHKERNLQKKAELQAQLYQQAKRQFKIMNKMIVELLETSKTVRRELNIMPLELDLSSLCNEIMLNLKPKLEQKNQKLIKDIPQDLPSVYADAELIRQVMVNLLENAIKYTPNNGQITISILHKTAGKIQASISDNGPGIPEEKRELIFSGHFRLQRDETTDGYGIGLALCRKVINSHYGQIWVDNNADQGSSFHFTLPVYR
jgi:two-component system clock-associated histidine kinase SasA